VKTETYDPGWLRHRIVIEAASGTPDEGGGETRIWSTLATVWAHIEPVDGDERGIADHLAGVVTHQVSIRWRDDVSGGMRLAYRGRLFRILAVFDPDETRRYLVIKAEEVRI
jgi:SPP1 family predicted phage head-tail adaptor